MNLYRSIYDPNFRGRRSIRLKGYDYSRVGTYFITICTKNRECLFSTNKLKEILNHTWNDLPKRFPNIKLDQFIIMPNHFHGIIWIVGAPLGAPQKGRSLHIKGAASSAPTLGKIIRAFKSISAIKINRYLKRAENPLWQRNYYEHIIRNEKELKETRKYILDNPLHWETNQEYPLIPY